MPPNYPLPRDDVGSSAWTIMHQRASQFPDSPTESDRREFMRLVDQLVLSLNCPECTAHARQYMRDNPPDMSSRAALFAWTTEFHDSVRERQGKFQMGQYVELKGPAAADCPTCRPKGLQTHNPHGTGSSLSSSSANRGMLAGWDRPFAPAAHALGMQPDEFVDAHVPEFIGNLFNLGYESTLSPFGYTMASFLTAVGMIGIGLASRTSLVAGDRRMLSELAAHMLWTNLRYANPRISGDVMAGASAAGSAIAAGDINALWAALTAPPSGAPVARTFAADPAYMPHRHQEPEAMLPMGESREPTPEPPLNYQQEKEQQPSMSASLGEQPSLPTKTSSSRRVRFH